MIPTLPLRPRNRLASLILEALRDDRAREDLRRVAASTEPPPGWLEPDQALYAERLLARARAAVAAMAAIEAPPGDASRLTLAQTLEWARILFDAGLHFEVHEVLEPHWLAAEGAAREALQGLIQIAVGFQHVGNGNLAGGRALLGEGAARLRHGRLPGLDADVFAARVEEAVEKIPAVGPVPPFPMYREPGRHPDR